MWAPYICHDVAPAMLSIILVRLILALCYQIQDAWFDVEPSVFTSMNGWQWTALHQVYGRMDVSLHYNLLCRCTICGTIRVHGGPLSAMEWTGSIVCCICSMIWSLRSMATFRCLHTGLLHLFDLHIFVQRPSTSLCGQVHTTTLCTTFCFGSKIRHIWRGILPCQFPDEWGWNLIVEVSALVIESHSATMMILIWKKKAFQDHWNNSEYFTTGCHFFCGWITSLVGYPYFIYFVYSRRICFSEFWTAVLAVPCKLYETFVLFYHWVLLGGATSCDVMVASFYLHILLCKLPWMGGWFWYYSVYPRPFGFYAQLVVALLDRVGDSLLYFLQIWLLWTPFMACYYRGCEGNAVFVYPRGMDAVCFCYVFHFSWYVRCTVSYSTFCFHGDLVISHSPFYPKRCYGHFDSHGIGAKKMDLYGRSVFAPTNCGDSVWSTCARAWCFCYNQMQMQEQV